MTHDRPTSVHILAVTVTAGRPVVARLAAKPSRGSAARFRALATGNDRSMAAWEQLGLPPRYHGPTLIARGGMADLYRALDTALDRDVAIKVLGARFAADGEIRERFLREAHTAAQLSGHPAIVTIYDVGETDGLPYIVMEYLPRGSLAESIAAGGVEPSKAVRWLDDVAEALDHAHARGVVHRDVKPANLLLDDEGQVHVVDFGIANAGLLPSLTATGTVMGTSGYISPEQASGARAGPASDRYALAVVAFELLTGRRPFQGDSFAGEASAHVNAVPPRPSSINKALPSEVDAVLSRGLAKDPVPLRELRGVRRCAQRRPCWAAHRGHPTRAADFDGRVGSPAKDHGGCVARPPGGRRGRHSARHGSQRRRRRPSGPGAHRRPHTDRRRSA
jgi:Protein kinase domain